MTDLVEAASATGMFNTLIEAARIAGLVDKLKSPGPFTVFAPTDEAFSNVPKHELSVLLRDPEKLRSLLNFHIVEGKFTSSDLAMVDYLQTISGGELKIDASFWNLMSRLKVNDAIVIKPDIVADNGVCHAIDKVLTSKVIVAGAQI
ncbi:MAG: fasciclin domain-containing protein [Candidatus Bathyarchaeota archaeon]|nr:fasciclin domain-containing protein [Candidatus Bathyarchaeota archaeon]